MSLEAVLDATAIRAKTLSGLKDCYAITGSSQDDGTLTVVPQSLDSTPVAALFPKGGALTAGNTEKLLHRLELDIWERAADGGYAVQVLAPFVERCRVLFRTDLDVNGQATRCLMTGYGEWFPQSVNGQMYLVLPIYFEILETYFSSDYSVV